MTTPKSLEQIATDIGKGLAESQKNFEQNVAPVLGAVFIELSRRGELISKSVIESFKLSKEKVDKDLMEMITPTPKRT